MPALWLAAIAGLGGYAVLTVQLCLQALTIPYQIDYGEGLVLYQALRLARGQSIYKSIDEFPYVFSNYPPLFQAILSPFVAVLGPSFSAGRLLVLLATLALAVCAYVMVRRAGAGRLAGACAALLFLASPYVYHFAPLLRIDLPALLLSVIGILLLWSALPAQGAASAPRLALSALFLVLALYTKQSFIAAPLAAGVFLLLTRPSLALRFAVTLLILGLSPFLILQALTAGEFAFGLLTANVNPFKLSLLLSQIADFVRTFAVIIVLAIVGAVVGRSGRLSLLGCYGVTAAASVLLAGKVGAWENYFLEALFMLCVFAGLGLEALLRSPRRALQWLAPLALLLQLGLMWHDPRAGWQALDDVVASNRALAPLVARQDGMILSEDLGLLLVNGKDVPFFSFEYAQLAGVGRWDQRWETENLRQGRFALVILEQDTRADPDRYERFTREVLSALDSAYGVIASAGKYQVYAPQFPQRTLNSRLGRQISLLGYRLDGQPAKAARAPSDITLPPPAAAMPSLNPPPAVLRVSLLWRADQKPAQSYKVFVHLEDAGGTRVAQADGVPLSGLYPTNRWAANETVRDVYELALPRNLPAGHYTLRVGMYNEQTGERLAAVDGAASIALASLPVGTENRPPQPQTARRAAFSDGVGLLGFDAEPAQIRAGAPLTVTLYWQAERYVDGDDTVFVHLARAGAPPLAQSDSRPQGGAYGTLLWNPGEYVTDVHVLSIPRDLPAGTYRLLAGLYRQPGTVRVALADGSDSVVLTDFTVPP